MLRHKKILKFKKCAGCGKSLSLKNFYVDRRHKDGRASTCRYCERQRGKQRRLDCTYRLWHREYIKQWRKRTGIVYPDHRVNRKHNLWSKYKLTLREFNLKLKKQHNRCFICGGRFNGKICVDHNHKTKVVRELLCHHCNCGLGHFKDTSKLLLKAYQYLKDHETSPQ